MPRFQSDCSQHEETILGFLLHGLSTGTLDGDGFARVEGFDPGECMVTFPNLDKEAWEKE